MQMSRGSLGNMFSEPVLDSEESGRISACTETDIDCVRLLHTDESEESDHLGTGRLGGEAMDR